MQPVTVNPSQISADWSKNPRRKPEVAEIKELAASIRERGLLAPIIVAQVEKATAAGAAAKYRVVAGYRRFEACKAAELTAIPVTIVTVEQSKDLEKELFKVAVIENEQRKDLTTYEQAVAYRKLQEEGMTQKEVAAMVGKAQPTVGALISALKHSEDPAVMDPGILEAWKNQGPDQDSGKPGLYVPMSFLNSIGSRSIERQKAWLKENSKPEGSGKSAMDGGGEGETKSKRKKPLPRDVQVLEALSNLRAMVDGKDDEEKSYVIGASLYLIGFLKDPSMAKREIKNLAEAVGTDSYDEGIEAARAWTGGKGGKRRLWMMGENQIFPSIDPEDEEGEEEEGEDE